MKNYLRKKLYLILTAVGRLHNFLLPKIPKGNMKKRKILDFVKKRKIDFFNFFCYFFYFLVILKFLYYFGIWNF
jgi:hypothetical protein